MGPAWVVPEDEVEIHFVASGGPGGQHANRSNTKVDAVFRPADSATMPDHLRRRVIAKLGPAVRAAVDDERSQYRNRQLALERIREKVREAGKVERRRRATKPTRGSQVRRIEGKKRRGDTKRLRRRPSHDD